MYKNKTYISYLFLMNIIFFTRTTISMETTADNYNNHVNHIVRCTHKINRSFLNLCILSKETHHVLQQAQDEMNVCIKHISELENAIKEFYTFKQSKIKNVFEIIAKHSSQQIRKTINETIIPTISHTENIHLVNQLTNKIISYFTVIRNELIDANLTLKNDFEEDLPLDALLTKLQQHVYEVMKNYNKLLSAFANNQSSKNIALKTKNASLGSDLQSKVFSFACTLGNCILSNSNKQEPDDIEKLHQEMLILFSIKKDLENTIHNKPSSASSNEIIPIISQITGHIAWLPYSDSICNWAVKDDNIITETLIPFACGKKEYNEIKTSIFPIIKELHKRKLIRTLASSAHNFLENPIIKNIFSLILECKDEQVFINYSNDLQVYYFIELLECLYKSHKGSIRTLQHECQQFNCIIKSGNFTNTWQCKKGPTNNKKDFMHNYFVSIEKQKKIDLLQDLELRKKNIAMYKLLCVASVSMAQHNQANVIVHNNTQIQIYDTLDHYFKTFQNKITDVLNLGKLFISSLNPHYQLPKQQNIFFKNNQKIISLDDYEKQLDQEILIINAEIMNYKQDKKTILNNMIQAHKILEKNYKTNYAQAIANSPILQENAVHWDNTTTNIDNLYKELVELHEEKNNLYWFNIWRKITNNRAINRTTTILQHNITAYNTAKINTNRRDNNQPNNILQQQNINNFARETFLKNIHFSHTESLEILTLSQNPAFKNHKHIFSPLERAEMAHIMQANDLQLNM